MVPDNHADAGSQVGPPAPDPSRVDAGAGETAKAGGPAPVGGAGPSGPRRSKPSMDDAWPESIPARLRRQLQSLDEAEERRWTNLQPELEDWWLYHLDNKRSTLDDYLRHVEFQRTYEAQPVDYDGTPADLVRSFRLYWRVRKDQARDPDVNLGAAGLKKDLKTVKFAGNFLGIPENVWPEAPTYQPEDRELPAPETVSFLLHHDWTAQPNRSYENYLVRYFLFFTFFLGIGAPADTHDLRVQDIHPAEGWMEFPREKMGSALGGARRRRKVVWPEKLMDGYKTLSVEKWLNHREKCDPETDRLFPKPDGTAFASEQSLRRKVCKIVYDNDDASPAGPFKKWHPYLGRHWSCTARLIDTGMESDQDYAYNYDKVAKFHGHKDTDRLHDTYAADAEFYERRYGDNWIERALRPVDPGSGVHRNLEPSQYERRLGSWLGVSPSEVSGPGGI